MNKKRKFAITAMTSTVLAIAVIIILNLIAVALSDKISLSADFTKDGILDFADTTLDVVSELDMDVKIISLIPENDNSAEILQIDQILKKYATLSGKISYERADAKKNPAVLNNYKVNGEPLTDSYNIVFETERMYSVVRVADIITRIQYNNMDYAHAGLMSAEQHFTSAILKVTKGSDINAYVLSGHGEKFDAEFFETQVLSGSGYNFKPLSVITDDIPEDANILIITSPKTDYSVEDLDKIDRYLKNGGNLQIFVDAYTPAFENLFAYMAEWGINAGEGLVADNSADHFSKYRTSIIPIIYENEITTKLIGDNMQISFFGTRPIDGADKNDIKVIPIASTSDEGYVKKDIHSVFDTFEDGDKKQKSNVAMLAVRNNYSGGATKVYVSGSVEFLSGKINTQFYANLMSYMTDQPTAAYIMSKVVAQQQLVIKQSSIYIYSLVVIFIIPVIILAWGFIIWIKRRHL